MEIIGYIASLLIGISLGLIGAGGSILTVPVMVYLFHVPVLRASSYSLFVVGITSILGAFFQYKRDNVDPKVAIIFCLGSLTVVSLIRNFLMPVVPGELFKISGVPVSSSLASMVLFSFLMMAAAYAMVRGGVHSEPPAPPKGILPRLWFSAILVGVATGLLGVGGGFLLIPSLVLLLGLPMKKAIGTSLLIIALNSLAGFAVDLPHISVEWNLLGPVALIATAGILLGMAAAKKIPSQKLKLSFGWFVMVLGILIFVKELLQFITNIKAGTS